MQRIMRHHIGSITAPASDKAEIFTAAHMGEQFFAVHTSLKHYTQGMKKPERRAFVTKIVVLQIQD